MQKSSGERMRSMKMYRRIYKSYHTYIFHPCKKLSEHILAMKRDAGYVLAYSRRSGRRPLSKTGSHLTTRGMCC